MHSDNPFSRQTLEEKQERTAAARATQPFGKTPEEISEFARQAALARWRKRDAM